MIWLVMFLSVLMIVWLQCLIVWLQLVFVVFNCVCSWLFLKIGSDSVGLVVQLLFIVCRKLVNGVVMLKLLIVVSRLMFGQNDVFVMLMLCVCVLIVQCVVMMLGWWLSRLVGIVDGRLVGVLSVSCGCLIVLLVFGFLLVNVVS